MEHAPFDDEFEAERPKAARRKRPLWLILLPVLILILFLWPGWAGFYSEWLWFQELGFQRVFTRTLLTKFGLGAVITLISALLIWLNLTTEEVDDLTAFLETLTGEPLPPSLLEPL